MAIALTVLLFTTAFLAPGKPLLAAMVWAIGIAYLHMREEGRGKLWAYFGDSADFPLLKRLPFRAGFALIVLPAFFLQATASYLAFSGETVNVFWLSLLIGARIGDGLFSHALPLARGQKPLEERNEIGQPTVGQLNPGLSTGIIYLVDGLLLTALFSSALLAVPARETVILGATIGAGFFALVIPSLTLAGKLVPR